MNKRTVLITGASGGVGASLCRAFRSNGYWVIATDLRESEGVDCDAFIRQDLVQLSLSEDASIKFKKAVCHHLNGAPLNVLINNAAIQRLDKTDKITRQDWFDSLSVNLTAPLFLSQLFLDDLESSKGNIINISSVHEKLTKPNFVSYATTKAALSGLTRSLAVDLGGRVRVNAIRPAATATEMLLAGFLNNDEAFDQLKSFHPIGRIAEPSEIAGVALFLASEAASFITGACMNVDGGVLARLHDPG